MSPAFELAVDTATPEQILTHLAGCDPAFVADLRTRVDIPDYVQKLVARSTRMEAWTSGTLVGLVALYANNETTRIAFITHVSVMTGHQGAGIARTLVSDAMGLAAERGMTRIDLEVATDNARARALYRNLGLADVRDEGRTTMMSRALDLEREHDDD